MTLLCVVGGHQDSGDGQHGGRHLGHTKIRAKPRRGRHWRGKTQKGATLIYSKDAFE